MRLLNTILALAVVILLGAGLFLGWRAYLNCETAGQGSLSGCLLSNLNPLEDLSYPRGAGTPLTCAANEEYDAGLCYPPCEAGFFGVGPVCWEICPDEYTDDGATCRKYAHIIGKASYGRSVGTVPSDVLAATCDGNQELDAGLCYESCQSGYTGVGPVCWEMSCPEGYADDGATCRRDVHIFSKDSYGRGVGTIPSDIFAGTCSGNQEYDTGLCYPPCNSGYDGVGPVCWRYCPSDYTDDGATCRKDAHIIGKDSYGRGVGTIPPEFSAGSCGANEELDAGLCYQTCDEGYTGVGPVCWESSCPEGYTDDGATCRLDVHIFGKESYGRGVGVPIHTCAAGMEEDAGLCYTPCEDGYSGVGPVCWRD